MDEKLVLSKIQCGEDLTEEETKKLISFLNCETRQPYFTNLKISEVDGEKTIKETKSFTQYTTLNGVTIEVNHIKFNVDFTAEELLTKALYRNKKSYIVKLNDEVVIISIIEEK